MQVKPHRDGRRLRGGPGTSFSYSSTSPVVQPGFSPACRHTEHFIFYLSSSTARRIPFVASEPHPTLYCLVRQRLQGISTGCIYGVAVALPSAESDCRNVTHGAFILRLPTGGCLLCVLNQTSGVLSGTLPAPGALAHDWCAAGSGCFPALLCISITGEGGLSEKRSLQSQPKELAVGGLGWGLGICLLNKFSQVILLQGVQSVSV